jgi:hypothetical protein
MTKDHKIPNSAEPHPIIGLDGPSTFVDNAAVFMRGNIARIVFCEANLARTIVAMQIADACAIAEQIIGGRNEMLRQQMAKGEGAPSSPIVRPQ